MKSAKKITLPNGLRILLIPQAGVAATALILVAAGSEYEKKNWNGLSHFLEHMVFKGTTKRPKPGMTAEALDSLGAEYNAFTGQEYTGYWAKAENRKIGDLLELVSDLYLDPLFNTEEIDKERGVVIEELNMYEDMPMRRVQENFPALLYGDQPAGWDVGGTKDIIAELKRPDFLKYRAARYKASTTIVAVAGDFDQAAVAKQIRAAFGKLPKEKAAPKPKVKEFQKEPRTHIKFKESDQSHLVIGTRTFSMFDKRRWAAELLAHVLGGGMSSRLFIKIREELGAAYYVRCGTDMFLDHGYLAISAGVNHPKLETVIEAILAECVRLVEEPIGKMELRKIKDHLIGTFMLSLETSDQLANFYAEQELMSQKMISPKEVAKKIEAVTAEEIQALAKHIFRNDKLNMALIGPVKNPAPLEKLIRFRPGVRKIS